MLEILIFLAVILAIVTFVLFLGYCSENQMPFTCLLTIVGALVAIEFLTPYSPIIIVWNNPVLLFLALPAYVVIGVSYGIFRWWRYSVSVAAEFEKFIEKYHRPEYEMKDYKHLFQSRRSSSESFPPQVKNHKQRIITWMIAWPASALWMIVDDLILSLWRNLKRLYDYIYRKIAGILQGITDRAFAKYED